MYVYNLIQWLNIHKRAIMALKFATRNFPIAMTSLSINLNSLRIILNLLTRYSIKFGWYFIPPSSSTFFIAILSGSPATSMSCSPSAYQRKICEHENLENDMWKNEKKVKWKMKMSCHANLSLDTQC